MRDGGSTSLYANSAYWVPVVASWLGGDLLSEEVPVTAGRVTADASQQVPERVTLTVSRTSVVDGVLFDWFPGDDAAHPLARYGQTLDVSVLVVSAGSSSQTKLGRFLIQSWSEQDDGAISVEAVGVLQLVSDDRLVKPIAPRASGTLVSEFNRLLPDTLSVSVDPALVDRRCPASMEWSEDRLAALYDIADAWPARLRTDAQGTVLLLAPLSDAPIPLLSLRDGESGVVVGAPREDTRDQAYNRVVARADNADAGGTSDTPAPPIQSVVDQVDGPMSTSGPYGIVTLFYSSPLLSTREQARLAATAMLARSMLPSRTIPVEIVPDPRLELDDPIEVWRDGNRWWGYVVAYDIPLTVGDGSMQFDLGLIA